MGEVNKVKLGLEREMTLILLRVYLSFLKKKKPRFSQFRKKKGTTSETKKSSSIRPLGNQSRGRSRSFGWTSDWNALVADFGQGNHFKQWLWINFIPSVCLVWLEASYRLFNYAWTMLCLSR